MGLSQWLVITVRTETPSSVPPALLKVKLLEEFGDRKELC